MVVDVFGRHVLAAILRSSGAFGGRIVSVEIDPASRIFA